MLALLGRRRPSDGFTLIEMLVVVLIVGILLAVAAPAFLGQSSKAQDSAAKQMLAVAYKSAKSASVDNSPQGAWVDASHDQTTLANAVSNSEPELAVQAQAGAPGATKNGSGQVMINLSLNTTTYPQPALLLVDVSQSGNVCQLLAPQNGQISLPNCTSASAAGVTVPTGTSSPQVTVSSAQVGYVASVSNNGSWTGNPVYTYQWQSSADGGTTWSNIAGQTASSYTLQSSDIGNLVRVAVTGSNAAGSLTQFSSSLGPVYASMPVGTLVAYAGSGTPANWLQADGSCVSQTTYSALYAAIGSTYGSSCAAGQFQLPDLRGRFPLGKSASGTGSTLGSSGGSLGQSSNSTLASQTFSFSLPAQSVHVAAWGWHTHTWYDQGYEGSCCTGNGDGNGSPYYGVLNTTYLSGAYEVADQYLSSPAESTTVAGNESGSFTGSLPPYRVLTYLISTNANSAPPCGAVYASAATANPSGTLAANGQAASGGLASCLGAAYSGNVPDLRGSIPLGQAASGTGSTLNGSGGSLDQTQSVTITQPALTANFSGYVLPLSDSHTHSVNYQVAMVDYWSEPNTGSPYDWQPLMWNGNCSTSSYSTGCGVAGYNYLSNPTGNTVGNANPVNSGSFTPSGSSSAATSTVTSSTFHAPYEALNYVAYNAAAYSPAAGTITPYAGSSVPAGWLQADGSCVNQSDYPVLYAAIGSTYGSCSSGQFALPNLSGRFAVGKTASGTASVLGESGGSLGAQPTVTLPAWSPQVTIPAHSFAWTFSAHYHQLYAGLTCDGYSGCTGLPYNHGYTTYEWLDTVYNANSGGWATLTNTSVNGGGTVSSDTVAAQGVSASNPLSSSTAPLPALDPPYQTILYMIKT